jgi:hypothetical protein
MISSTRFQSSETKTVSVDLPVGYVDWIESKAEQHDASTAEVIQALVDMQRKRDAKRAARGDAPSESGESVADNLRSASKRLRSLVDRAEALDEQEMDVLDRVEEKLNGQLSNHSGDGQRGARPDKISGSDTDDGTQSMFDLMDDDS